MLKKSTVIFSGILAVKACSDAVIANAKAISLEMDLNCQKAIKNNNKTCTEF